MKKIIKALTALGTTALAVVGGVYIFRKFFAKDEELDEVFDDEELFDDDEDDEKLESFDDDLEIFEDDADEVAASDVEEAEEEETAKETSKESAVSVEEKED